MGQDCIFCKIVQGEIPSDTLYQDDEVIAIRDINPQAPVHVLVIPRLHIPTANDLAAEEHLPLAGHLLSIAFKLTEREGITSRGYRLTINSGQEGGQVVPHLHLHVLGGRQLSDSMG